MSEFLAEFFNQNLAVLLKGRRAGLEAGDFEKPILRVEFSGVPKQKDRAEVQTELDQDYKFF